MRIITPTNSYELKGIPAFLGFLFWIPIIGMLFVSLLIWLSASLVFFTPIWILCLLFGKTESRKNSP